MLFKNGNKNPVDRGLLFYGTDKTLDTSNIPKISNILQNFFTVKPKKIENPKKLSHLLAERTRLFRNFLEEFLQKDCENDFKMKLVGEGGLHDVIKETLIENLSISDFIDAYVQTITYGLFLAEINSKEEITEGNASHSIPESMGIIRDLFKTIDIEDIPDSIDWIIEEILDILNRVDREKIEDNLSFSTIYDNEDPYVYFYENFLGDYDKSKRKSKGVYYTPIPVVKFIVESIDYLIRQNFNNEGLKGSNVKVLDFATGTGTFLLETFMKALENVDGGMKQNLIKERLLNNFYGFEYLIAPYTIAHLKLSQFLKENNYNLESNERLKVYLTDTLDNSKHHALSYFQKITKEGQEASKIKLEEDVLILMGNPPYSSKSKNNKKWILELSELYKKNLNEKNIQLLNDDYIKFIRYAHWKIEKQGKGIIGIISNNSYLDGLIHRVMRKELLNTFDQIYILNLHGNKRKGDPDENVFDIMAGVSIAIFVKLPESLEEKEVYYYSTLEKGLTDRELKYGFLLGNNIESVQWNKLEPINPDYWFIKKNLSLEKEYKDNFSLIRIFNQYEGGVESGRDKLFTEFSKPELEKRMNILFSGEYDKKFADMYNVKNTGGFALIDRLNKFNFEAEKIIKFHYRPFDIKWFYYKEGLVRRPSLEVMKQFLGNQNIGLISVRQFAEDKIFNHAFISNNVVDRRITLSNRGAGYLFPLYIYFNEKKQLQTILESKTFENPYKDINPQPNFTEDFIKFIATKYTIAPSPEEVLGYIYAVLYSKTYREKYNEFLKTDFPRIPFTDDFEKFKMLSNLGLELIETHLLEKAYGLEIAKYPVEGSDIISKIKYDKEKSLLYINKDQYFENVPEEVWNMEIGGYKVLDKWLKYRKEIKLSFGDINHFQKVARALNETIDLMDKIDEIYNSQIK